MIVLVDHRDDPDHAAAIRAVLVAARRDRVHALPPGQPGRFLTVDDQAATGTRSGRWPERCCRRRAARPECWVPFLYPFIGYDGHYYLCSSDWRKEVDLGTVFEHSLVDLFDEKAEQVRGRTPDLSPAAPTNRPTRWPGRWPRPPTGASRIRSSPPSPPSASWPRSTTSPGASRPCAPTSPTESTTRGPTNRRLIPVRS